MSDKSHLYKQTAGPGMNGAFITSLHRQQRYRRQILSAVKRRAHSSQQGCSLAKQYYVCADRERRNPDLISVVCPSAKRAGRSSRSSVRTQFSVVRTSEYGVDSLVQMCLVPWFGSGRRGGGGGGGAQSTIKTNCLTVTYSI